MIEDISFESICLQFLNMKVQIRWVCGLSVSRYNIIVSMNMGAVAGAPHRLAPRHNAIACYRDVVCAYLLATRRDHLVSKSGDRVRPSAIVWTCNRMWRCVMYDVYCRCASRWSVGGDFQMESGGGRDAARLVAFATSRHLSPLVVSRVQIAKRMIHALDYRHTSHTAFMILHINTL